MEFDCCAVQSPTNIVFFALDFQLFDVLWRFGFDAKLFSRGGHCESGFFLGNEQGGHSTMEFDLLSSKSDISHMLAEDDINVNRFSAFDSVGFSVTNGEQIGENSTACCGMRKSGMCNFSDAFFSLFWGFIFRTRWYWNIVGSDAFGCGADALFLELLLFLKMTLLDLEQFFVHWTCGGVRGRGRGSGSFDSTCGISCCGIGGSESN